MENTFSRPATSSPSTTELRLRSRRRLLPPTVNLIKTNISESRLRNEERLEEFRPVTRQDMPRIWSILHGEKGRTTDFSYGGLLMWVNYFNYEFAILKNTLFIRGLVENDRETPAFSLPVGELPLSESIPMIKDYCRRKGMKCELSAVPEYAMQELSLLSPSYTEELTDWADYLYDAEPLATLKGKKMSKKRNHVNRFNALYPEWTLEDMTPGNASEAMDFMDIFDLEGDNTRMAISERHLTRELIGHVMAGDNELKGALLKVGGQVAAFTIGDIKGDTLFVHVEKATRNIEGSYEKINQAFAARMMERYPQIRFINREDDAGDEGLRKAKESYHPVEKLKKYNVIFG
ncbi:MAG: DUF2156 domain-containing protein [Bacteroides sp.]|nr:DUF2156 domain-containing protein [Bacteroides sp.]